MSSIDEIKAKIDIVDLVSETVQLRRSGKSYTGFCPFHPNTRTPAFVVFPETGTWRCFGQCNEGGDIFHFVMKKEGWDFSEALHYLADKANVQLKPPTPEEQALVEEHDALRSLLEDAVTFYRHNLTNTPAGQQALDYLHQRGLSDATIEAFGLGYAPNAWEAALTHFKSRGHSEHKLLEAGLVSERVTDGQDQDGRRVYDRFRHRIMFPIRDQRGRMAGFGARILNPEDLPKFLNSPQTPVFDKSRLLYGLDRARRAIRSAEQAVIVEGYLDVIALHQAGFDNAVSPMGTALTEHHLRLLKRLTRQIVLALDPDAAGDKATLRGLQIARQTLDHSAEPFFDARGLLAHETRLQADIRVTTLPQGLDPDEVVQRDPDEWQRIVREAKPVVVHVMETLVSGRNVDDAKVKSEVAAQVLPLIKDVPNAVEREAYRQQLARLIRVDERALQGSDMQGRTGRSSRRREPSATPGTPGITPRVVPLPARTRLEAHCLGVLMRRPELVFRIDRELQKYELPRLSRADFDRADYQTIFSLIEESLAQDISEPASFVLNGLSLPLMELADELLKKTEDLDPVEDRVLDDILRGLLDLRRREVNQNINHLKFMMGEIQEQGDLRSDEYQQNMLNYLQALKRIDKALGRFTSRLVSSNSR